MTDDDVAQAADAIVAEGAKPTAERIRDKIGGSYRDIGPLLREWKQRKGYGATQDNSKKYDNLPPYCPAIDKYVANQVELRCADLKEEIITLQRENEELRQIEKDYQQYQDETKKQIAELERQIAELNAQIDVQRRENEKQGIELSSAREENKNLLAESIRAQAISETVRKYADAQEDKLRAWFDSILKQVKQGTNTDYTEDEHQSNRGKRSRKQEQKQHEHDGEMTLDDDDKNEKTE